MDTSKLPIEMVEYRHSMVYAIPCGFGNDTEGFNELVYIPAIEDYALGTVSEMYCELQCLKEEHPDDPSIKDIEATIDKWLARLAKLLCTMTSRDKCKLVPTVIDLPRIKKNEENSRCVWECQIWPPCNTKHEAWHIAMSLCDVEIGKIKEKVKKEEGSSSDE